MPQAAATQPRAASRQSDQHSSLTPVIRRQNEYWLDWQCKLLTGIFQASLFVVKSASSEKCVENNPVLWPRSLTNATALSHYANAAISKQQVLLHKIHIQQASDTVVECLAIPMPARNPQYVLCLLSQKNKSLPYNEIVRSVSWGSYWLLSKQAAAQLNVSPSVQSRSSFESILQPCLSASTRLEVIYTLASQVAKYYGCERVSVGLIKGRVVRVEGISGQPTFDSRMRLVTRIARAMDESYELGVTIDTQRPQPASVPPRHIDLAAELGGRVVSVLLTGADHCVGVLTLEFGANKDPSNDISKLEFLCAQITPLITVHGNAEENMIGLLKKKLNRFYHGLSRSPKEIRDWAKPLASFSLVMFFLLSMVLQGEHRINASAVLEGNNKQVVVSPVAGYIRSTNARSGDTVTKDDIIATIDDSELQVEKDKWLVEQSKIEKKYAQALASGNRVELSLAIARKNEIDAELALVIQKIERSNITAPDTGVIVSGDLSQLLGAPVEQGEVLFELASLDEFRLMLDVDERDVAHVHEGQAISLRLASTPGDVHTAIVKSVQPLAAVSNGKNVFRTEAELTNADLAFRPGMQGVARIAAGKKTLYWLWTHKLFDRIRIWLWSFSL